VGEDVKYLVRYVAYREAVGLALPAVGAERANGELLMAV
jgi:hypothetical protein